MVRILMFPDFYVTADSNQRMTEVQAKKHFTAEELSMRRAEMARRRRNLSDKRNEEVKVTTTSILIHPFPAEILIPPAIT